MLWLFMAAYMLNFSLDTSYAKSQNNKEDLICNDVESITENVLEKTFDIENVIIAPVFPKSADEVIFEIFCYKQNLVQYHPEILIPPPWLG